MPTCRSRRNHRWSDLRESVSKIPDLLHQLAPERTLSVLMLVTGDVVVGWPIARPTGAAPAPTFGLSLFRFQVAPAAAARAPEDSSVLVRLPPDVAPEAAAG